VRASTSPLVSVLLPVHNGERFLAAALESIVGQTLHDLECLVVDDASTDASREIATRYAQRDARVRVLGSSTHRGLVAALNAAVAAASAPYLARMDADDIALPERLACQVRTLEGEPAWSVVGCRIRYLGSGLDSPSLARYVDWQNSVLSPLDIERDLFVESPLVHPTVVMRRDALDAVGGYRDRGWPEDYDLWMRMLQPTGAAAKHPESLLIWRDHAGRLTRLAPAYRLERFRQLKWHYLQRCWLRPGESLQVCGAGPTGRWWVRALSGAGFHVSAVVDIDPRRAGGRCRGVPIVGYDGLRPDRGRFLAAVASQGARQEIRSLLSAAGLTERRDFIAVA
jgi:glycosyltransferase involved in cell wall biosynthesis